MTMTTTLETGLHAAGRRVRPSTGRHAASAPTSGAMAARHPGSQM